MKSTWICKQHKLMICRNGFDMIKDGIGKVME